MTNGQRRSLEDAILDMVRQEPTTSYAIASRTQHGAFAQIAHADDKWWRKVDGALQRLRKRKLIASKRDGSFSLWHALKPEPPDIDAAVRAIEASNMEMARAVTDNGAQCVAVDISRAISLIDISKSARVHSGNEAGDAYLDHARELLLSLIGIAP